MKQQYVAPALNLDAFNCPHCHAFTHQDWFGLRGSSGVEGYGNAITSDQFQISTCHRCHGITIWYIPEGNSHSRRILLRTKALIIFPEYSQAEPANPDMPADAKVDYDEARHIAQHSPRGAAALLRLAIQKLCKHLGQSGQNINSDIKALVAGGLSAHIQRALDTVRVIGNNAVHPGTMDISEDTQTVTMLFIDL